MIIKEGKTAFLGVRYKEPLRIECEHFIECIKKILRHLLTEEMAFQLFGQWLPYRNHWIKMAPW